MDANKLRQHISSSTATSDIERQSCKSCDKNKLKKVKKFEVKNNN